MRNCIVVTVDGARARIYGLVRLATRDLRGLEELESMVNPEHNLHDSEIYAESRPGLKKDVGTGIRAAVDEHRQDHATEVDRRFAADVIAAAARHALAREAFDMVLVAGPDMLGLLRAEARGADRRLTVREHGKHLTQVSADELYARLEAEQLLPPRALS